MEKDQKISLRIGVLGLLCASLSFVFGSASVSAATYTNKYTEDFSTTTYKDSDKTTLNWSTNTKDLYLPWDYAKKVTSGTAVSKKINMSSDFVTGARLTDLSTFQEGSTGKSFYLSNDGGKTWLAVSSGKDISFVSTGNDLRWKIVLNNTYFPGAVSVTVGGLTVSYTTTNASLNIALAGKTITAKKGDKGVELETLNFISKGSQSILLHNLVFRATSGTASATKALDAVYLYKGSTQVAKATLNSENNFKFDSSFTIPANSSLSLTIKGDISSTTALSSLILDLSSYNVGYSNTSDDVESYFSGTSSVVKISDNTTSPIAKYTLIVANGTGSGSYASGTKVAISATSGKVFDKWTGDTKYVADVNSAGTTVTMPAQAITVTATYKAASSPIRWCSWHTNIDPDRYQPNWDEVTVIIYSAWQMKSDGSIIPADNMERFKKVRDLAHQHNKKFIIEIAKGYESDNWYTLDNVIANHKTEFADNVLDMLKTYGADGVDLDFEYPSPDKNSVTNTPNTPLVEAFFKTLHTKLKAANSDYLISADTGRLTLFAVYANSNLSQYIDYIMHMGYHYTGDYHTGANSPFNDPKRFDVKDAVEDLLKYYPSQKIILGLPLWGYESQTDSDQPYAKVTKGSRKQIDLKTVIDRAAKYGRLWDTNSNSPWYRYKVGDKWYQGWYDDGESFRLKYNYIKSVNLGGIGCHALGWEAGYPTYENGYPEIWKEIFSDAYSLTVTNGSGSGSFIQGNKIDIIASSAPSDKVFDKWTGDTSYIASVTSASTSVTMPDKAVHLTATYKTASSSQPTGRSNIKDGAMIRVKGGIDVYIVKYNNGKQFKRLILSPSVFRSYGHLKWKDIIEVDQATLDSYTTSNLVYVAGDKRVWRLEPAGDNGKRSDCTSSSYDADGVYEINTTDRDSYKA